MDAADTLDAVREASASGLERLGSDKLLVAVTGADLTSDAVREAAVTRERGRASALAAWADESEGAIADAFDAAASAASERADRIPRDDVTTADAETDALSAHLETVDGTAEQIGAGLVASPLVADRFYLQVVSFFVNEADEGSADAFREMRTAASDLDPARDALAELDDEGRETARDAAVEAIDVAYEEYAETLTEMGLDPKPTC
ncbi:transcription antitermination protein [Haloarcula nitratireducens]|uniref:Transcription antitermination protein n=1 Tax=Haloarcula nitratireducens TaxID=2487749 RepID=A0AAW4PBF0_9EURY|nr:transcription antitermination protein [Halomicroarcula nitratireducens]MBX0295209.1 transcription antitermination protein [Halomicroarcula nitratireducens]